MQKQKKAIKILAGNVRDYMRNLSYSPDELANQLGLDRSNVYRMLQGKQMPEDLDKLARVLHTTVSSLFADPHDNHPLVSHGITVKMEEVVTLRHLVNALSDELDVSDEKIAKASETRKAIQAKLRLAERMLNEKIEP